MSEKESSGGGGDIIAEGRAVDERHLEQKDPEGVILDSGWEVIDPIQGEDDGGVGVVEDSSFQASPSQPNSSAGQSTGAGVSGLEQEGEGDEGAGAPAELGAAASDDTESSMNQANDGAPAEAKESTATDSMPLPLHWTRLGQPMPTDDQEPCGDDGAAGGAVDGPRRRPQDVVMDPIDPSDLELVIVGTAGQKIHEMGSNLQDIVNPQLEQLVLRSHLIREIQGIDKLSHLELLELYDNQLTSLDGLALASSQQGLLQEGDVDDDDEAQVGTAAPPESTTHHHRVSMRVLDMSYNVIRDMDPVQWCPNLQELYLANNKLKAMAGLEGLSKLRKLDLGANRIRVMDPNQLKGLTSLEELWLGKNKIESIQGLEPLLKLRRLDLQSNRLTSVENLTSQVDTLEELYLSHNGIDSDGCTKSTGLALPFSCLAVLDVSRNRVDSTAPFAHLTSLEELWLSGNQIATFEDVKPASKLTNLETIYLEHNPVQRLDPLYRKTLAALIPNLKQIDANMITAASASTAVGVGIVPTASSSPRPATSTSAAPIVVVSEEEELRRLQEAVVQRARAETEAKKKAMQQLTTSDGDEQPPPRDEPGPDGEGSSST